eukprot:Gregarina_sp_Poly_1__5388@NODE_2846_length_1639_cov_11_200382_g1795_i0_p1_GENE_NODE_2846_length_1639_cov_11_200382_g1795_i0NODE_2846_length_1639_cov_11_200382_g1795_i0_p1_ORF_typecomplete_len207_score7_46Triabin/PF03973_13/0_022Triabin/PF03973_13/5_4e02Lipocalin/PF00061_23/0_16_NODE_2846_length_1639_cov_11_200382_g1795_i09871607
MATSQLYAILLVITCLTLGVESQYEDVSCTQGTPLAGPGSGSKVTVDMSKIVNKDWYGLLKREDETTTPENSENCLTVKFTIPENNKTQMQLSITTRFSNLTKNVITYTGTMVDNVFVEDEGQLNQYFIDTDNTNYFSMFSCKKSTATIYYYNNKETAEVNTTLIPDDGNRKTIKLTRNRCNGASTLVYQSLTTMLLFFFSMKYFL